MFSTFPRSLAATGNLVRILFIFSPKLPSPPHSKKIWSRAGGAGRQRFVAWPQLGENGKRGKHCTRISAEISALAEFKNLGREKGGTGRQFFLRPCCEVWQQRDIWFAFYSHFRRNLRFCRTSRNLEQGGRGRAAAFSRFSFFF